MAVTIRLTRVGAKKQPRYRIVASTKRSKNTGQALEVLGHYLPLEPQNKQIVLDMERYNQWLQNGALPSRTVLSLAKKLS